MKFCPYCGAAIIGGAAPFCAECGKPLPRNAKTLPPLRKPATPAAGVQPPKQQANKRPSQPPLRRKKSRPYPKKPSKNPSVRKPDPRDEGYDGYYDDIVPVDNGHTRDKMNPELLKRITIMSCVALLVIILSVVVMYLL